LQEAKRWQEQAIVETGIDAGCPKWADPYKYGAHVISERTAEHGLPGLLAVVCGLTSGIAILCGFIILCWLDPELLKMVVAHGVFFYICYLIHNKLIDMEIKREMKQLNDDRAKHEQRMRELQEQYAGKGAAER
jgi:hypothetical protein